MTVVLGLLLCLLYPMGVLGGLFYGHLAGSSIALYTRRGSFNDHLGSV